MSTTATLAYSATATGPTTPAALEAAMAAVVLDPVPINEVTGSSLTSDTTGLAGPVATRTLVFNITSADFQTRFPPATDQASPFRDLFTHVLAHKLNTKIAVAPVVIA